MEAMLTFLMSALLKFAHAERVPHGAVPPTVMMTGREGAHGGAGGPRAQPHIAPPLFESHCYAGDLDSRARQRLLKPPRLPFRGNFEVGREPRRAKASSPALLHVAHNFYSELFPAELSQFLLPRTFVKPFHAPKELLH